ncbi:serine/threonine-protein kinase [Nocardia carnea]|uniref:serine/threonine-protein kinase n=1 Tax=Nocardia carnea TaxID=37328 RepID=UPI0024543C16|nr:serine/threonine-protein kinase [Nocardia carnea]
MTVDSLHPDDPRAVGRYTVLARLGAGANGVVYLAASPGRRSVAVKVFHPHVVRDPDFRRSFDREVRATRAVGGFHSAALVDARRTSTSAWLVTDYLAAPSLHQLVTTCGALPETAVAMLGRGIAEALAAFHAAGVVHRDLKPSNVLVTLDGPRVIDFGIADVDGAVTATAGTLGTPGFMSPEQATGNVSGPAGDMYSLGALLVYAATGQGPFGKAEAAVLVHRAATASSDLSALPHGPLRQAIAACLARNPMERPTPSGMLVALGSAGADPADALPAAVAAHVRAYGRIPDADLAPPDRSRRFPLLLGAVLLVVILLLGGAIAVRTARAHREGFATAAAPTTAPSTAPFRIETPIAGGLYSLALSANDRELFVVSSSGVSFIDTTTNKSTRSVPISARDYATVSPDGRRVYAYSLIADRTTVHDATSGAEIGSLPIGRSSFGAFSPAGDQMYLQSDSSLATVDLHSNTVVGKPVPLPRSPSRFSVTPDGRTLYIAEFSLMTDPENRISVFDTGSGKVTGSIDVGGRARDLALSADGRRAAVINWDTDRLSMIDTATNSVAAVIPLGQSVSDVALSPDGSSAFATVEGNATVLVVDTAAQTIVDRIRVGRRPSSLAVSADGRRLYVAGREDQLVTVVPIESR